MSSMSTHIRTFLEYFSTPFPNISIHFRTLQYISHIADGFRPFSIPKPSCWKVWTTGGSLQLVSVCFWFDSCWKSNYVETFKNLQVRAQADETWIEKDNARLEHAGEAWATLLSDDDAIANEAARPTASPRHERVETSMLFFDVVVCWNSQNRISWCKFWRPLKYFHARYNSIL